MKKILLFAAMALTMVGCTEDYKDWLVQKPDTTPDPAITVSQNMTDVAPVSFTTLDAYGDVQLFVPTYESSSNPDSVTYTAVIYNADKSDNVELKANAEGKVSADELKTALETFYGRSAEKKSVPATFIARVYNGKMVSKEVHETVLDVTIPYHTKSAMKALSVPGSHQGWDPANYDQALYEQDPENNPNVFTGYVYLDAGTQFKFTTGSWAENWGTEDGKTLVPGASNASVAEAGCYYITVDLNKLEYTMELRNWSIVGDGVGDTDIDLAFSQKNGVFFVTHEFNGTGYYKFRVNHKDDINYGFDWFAEPTDLIQNGFKIPVPGTGVYSITLTFADGYPVIEVIEGSDINKFPPYVYFIGATDGWKNAEQRLVLTDGSGVYTGYLYCADPNGWGNKFKFQREAGNWDTQVNAEGMTFEGDFAAAGDDDKNMAAMSEGVYFVTLDLKKKNIKATKIEYMGITGDYCGWNEGVEMTWNATDYCYELTGAGVNDKGWKFRANGMTDPDWKINLGSNDTTEPSPILDDLVGNGKNIGVVGSTIKLYPTRRTSDKIFCTVE